SRWCWRLDARAPAGTRSRVSSRIGTPVARPLRIRDAVVTDTPDRSATSRSVVDPDRGRPFVASSTLDRALGGIVAALGRHRPLDSEGAPSMLRPEWQRQASTFSLPS